MGELTKEPIEFQEFIGIYFLTVGCYLKLKIKPPFFLIHLKKFFLLCRKSMRLFMKTQLLSSWKRWQKQIYCNPLTCDYHKHQKNHNIQSNQCPNIWLWLSIHSLTVRFNRALAWHLMSMIKIYFTLQMNEWMYDDTRDKWDSFFPLLRTFLLAPYFHNHAHKYISSFLTPSHGL